MKNVFWALIGIATVMIFAEGYALYKIPQAQYIKGQLTYDGESNIEPGTIFKLSLESRPQGDKKFNILSAAEQNVFSKFPQNFTLPILKKSLSRTGIYQLRVQIIKDNQLLYSNRELLPLTRDELNGSISVAMQAARKAQAKQVIQPQPMAAVEEEVLPIVKTVEPVKLDIVALLGNKQWFLEGKGKKRPYLTFDIQKKRVFGSGGCNDFQGGYQIEQNLLVMKHFISTAKRCATGMEVETNFLDALNKVSEWLVEEGKLRLYDKDQLLLLQFSSQ
ncbi:MAG: heat shock protein HslJ [Psychromonas sp.]|jgi:heat shock protein HslJ|uniref:META domain-containing protein n=1 Tax=Psychromonas sp. TaxID=1884585 RepID=UPI0039E5812A